MRKQHIYEKLSAKLNSKSAYIKYFDEEERQRTVLGLCDEVLLREHEHTANNLRMIFKTLFEHYDAMTFVSGINQRAETYRMQITAVLEEGEEFDTKYNVDTSRIIEHFEMEELISYDYFLHNTRYFPTPLASYKFVFKKLKLLNIDYKDYTFIDIGSGLGRNLFIASEEPFKRIIGVEISKYLHNGAMENLKNYKNVVKDSAPIEFYCEDATKFKFPEEENLILYFWEPFSTNISVPFTKNLTEFI